MPHPLHELSISMEINEMGLLYESDRNNVMGFVAHFNGYYITSSAMSELVNVTHKFNFF